MFYAFIFYKFLSLNKQYFLAFYKPVVLIKILPKTVSGWSFVAKEDK